MKMGWIVAASLWPAALLAETAQEPVIRWEAETARLTSLSTEGSYRPRAREEEGIPSGGAWLNGSYKEGDFAEYEVSVPESGDYHFYIRKYWQHGPLRWRFGEQAWTTINKQMPLMASVEMRKWVVLSWIEAGTVKLEKGSHKLRIELLKNAAYQFDKAVGLDCFILSQAPWQPAGAATLPAASATTRPAAAATSRPAAPISIDETSIPAEADTTRFGLHLPQTMALLEASNRGDIRPIRVLFYGQSIVAQGRLQSTLLAELRRRYPKANLVATSRAIGGYTAPQLVRTMVHDVTPYRPDLIVFDDYAGEKDGTYEQILRFMRSSTTAEVLLWSHHLDNFGTAIDKDREEASTFRRNMATKYGCEFADVRGVWRAYLEKQGLPRTALLTDAIHNNNAGCELMARILARHFVVNPQASQNDSVRTLPLHDPARWAEAGIKITGPWRAATDGQAVELASPQSRLELTFTGVRVDIVAGPTGNGRAQVLVDGKIPSSLTRTWVALRASPAPIGWFPAVNRISLGDAAPLQDNYTLHFFDVTPDASSFRYRLIGQKSGPDGEGTSADDFVSASGRILISKRDFSLANTARALKKPFPSEFDVTFRVHPLGLDVYEQRANREGAQTLLDGLANGPHTMTLQPDGAGTIAIREIIIHRPNVNASAEARVP